MKGRGTLVAAALVMLAAQGWAQTPNKCQGSKVKGAGKKAACIAGLKAKLVASGAAIDSAKVAKCQAKVGVAFAKLEGKGDCSTSGDAGTIEAKVDAFLDDVTSELNVAGPNKCQGAKVKGAGKKAACLAGLKAKLVGAGAAIDSAKVTKCQAKVGAAFAKLEGKGDCSTSGDAGSIESKVDAFADDLASELSAGGGSPCGNGAIDANETCDDGNNKDESTSGYDPIPPDTCPSSCQIGACTASSGTLSVSVNFSSTSAVGGYKVFVDYPEDKVAIGGTGDPAPGTITNDPTNSATPNDLDYGILVVAGSTNAISGTRLFTINFTPVCSTPTAAEFSCTVKQASSPGGDDIPMTCSVSIP